MCGLHLATGSILLLLLLLLLQLQLQLLFLLPLLVIPAKAGIHLAVALASDDIRPEGTEERGLCRNDEP